MIKDIGSAMKITDIQPEKSSDSAEKSSNGRPLSFVLMVELAIMNEVAMQTNSNLSSIIKLCASNSQCEFELTTSIIMVPIIVMRIDRSPRLLRDWII